MYFNEIELGARVELAPAKIEKDKMIDFARLYDNIPLQPARRNSSNEHHGSNR